jgi:hypothetical protein
VNDFDSGQVVALLEQILERLSQPLVAIPLSADLWDVAFISRYVKRTPDTVRREIVVLPNFPKPIRLPGNGRAHALYKAREVVAWAEGLQSR